jgi:hypothetical protein
VLAAVNEYTNNNSGALPAGVGSSTSTTVIIGSSGNTATAKVGYIDGTKVTVAKLASGTAAGPTSSDTVKVLTNAICDTSSAGGATATGATSRNVVALYYLEGGAKLCQES